MKPRENNTKTLGMAKDRNGSVSIEEVDREDDEQKDRHSKSKRKKDESSESDLSDSEDDRPRSSKKSSKKRRHSNRSRKRGRRSRDNESSSSDSYSDSESESETESGSDEGSESEWERRRKRRRREKESEKERRRRKEKERKRRREKEERRRKRKDMKKDKNKKEKHEGKKGAVTNSWGKYGIIRETDMWNKRPEFTAWLAEVKKVNLETLANWEEKQMFKEFMEDHNTATFPSKKYYNLDAYHHRQLEKEIKKGLKRATTSERTEFNDEEQRRLELQRERERQKEKEVEALKRSMQTGMAQAMKEQARLREEMAYQYKLGNFEAAAAIQKRLDPDIAM